MGDINKLVAEVGGMPIVRRVVNALDDPRIVDRIVVLGAKPGEVRAALRDDDVRFVVNSEWHEGIASSIRAGVGAAAADVDGALIVPGDMPWLKAADIRPLLDAFEPAGGAGVCVPVSAGRRGNPVLWARRHFDTLMALTGDTGGRRLFPDLESETVEVPVRSAGVLVDVDTPEALAEARRQARG